MSIRASLFLLADNAMEVLTPLAQKLALIPSNPMHACLHVDGAAPPDHIYEPPDSRVAPLKTSDVISSLPQLRDKNQLSVAAPLPKSQILLKLPEMEDETKNQIHMVVAAGSFKAETVKCWELPPFRDALYVSSELGPVACAVGEEADAVSAPNRPDTSPRRFPWLNG